MEKTIDELYLGYTLTQLGLYYLGIHTRGKTKEILNMNDDDFIFFIKRLNHLMNDYKIHKGWDIDILKLKEDLKWKLS